MKRAICCPAILFLLASTSIAGPIVVPLNKETGAKAQFWLASSMQRIFNKTAPGDAKIELLSARNGRIAFQACFRNEQTTTLTVECKVIGADDLKPQIRYVGMV